MASARGTKRRGRQPGPMPLRVTEIPVLDKNGDRLLIIEREQRQRVPGFGPVRKLVSYSLDSGEPVQFIDDDTFLLKSRGEKFVRIK